MRACAICSKEYNVPGELNEVYYQNIRSNGQKMYNADGKKTGYIICVCMCMCICECVSIFCVCVSVSVCPLRVSALQLLRSSAETCWGPWLPLVQHTGPEVVRHTAPRQRKHGTETDSDGKTKNGRAVAEPHAAALVLQGTQPGSIAQAPNFF